MDLIYGRTAQMHGACGKVVPCHDPVGSVWGRPLAHFGPATRATRVAMSRSRTLGVPSLWEHCCTSVYSRMGHSARDHDGRDRSGRQLVWMETTTVVVYMPNSRRVRRLAPHSHKLVARTR